jgi:hypothetical protein
MGRVFPYKAHDCWPTGIEIQHMCL